MSDHDVRTEPPVRPTDVVEVRAVLGFADTVDRLEDEIAARGLQLFARIDHSANARAIGLDMPSATVLDFGHARGGTPPMLAAPALALDLPLRLLVRQAADAVVVAYHDPAVMLAQYGLPPSAASPLQVLTAIAATASR